MVRIAPGEAGAALGLFNMMRTQGGASGTAAIESFFPEREQFHSFIVGSYVSLLQSATRDRLAESEQYFMMCRFPDPTEHRSRCHLHWRHDPDPADDYGLPGPLQPARCRHDCHNLVGRAPAKRRRLQRRHALNGSTNETALGRLCFSAVSY
jgi:hypothetical protein